MTPTAGAFEGQEHGPFEGHTFSLFERHVLMDFKGAYMGVPIEGFTLLAHSKEWQVMYINDAWIPFKRAYTLVQNEEYTKGPFEGHFDGKHILSKKGV